MGKGRKAERAKGSQHDKKLKEMASFKQIDQARKILGLQDEVTLGEIKEAYRKLAMKYHPDRCKEKRKLRCEKMFKKVNNAYETLMLYCISYKFSLKKEEIEEIDINKAAEEQVRRFYDDWWGEID